MTTLQNGLQLVSKHKRSVATGVGLGAGAAIIGTALLIHSSKKRSKKSKRSSSRKVRKYKQRKPHTAGKRKDTSHRRIRYSKNNQPYIILRSGKARFISKKSAGSSRRRKGGRY